MYKAIGYSERSLGSTLRSSIVALYRDHGGADAITSNVKQLLSNHGADWEKKRFSRVYAMDWLTMLGADNARGVSSVSMLTFHVLQTFLHLCNRADAPFPVLWYRTDPSCTLSELIGDMIGDAMLARPVSNYLPPPEVVINWPDVLRGLSVAMSDWNVMSDQETVWEDRITRYFKHVKFKIKMGLTIDENEKSFYMHCDHPLYGKLPSLGDRTVSTVDPFEQSDPLVLAVGEKLRSLTLPGPKSNFVPIISSATKEYLIYMRIPKATELLLAAGRMTNPGTGLSRMEIKPLAKLPWSDSDALVALASSKTSSRGDTTFVMGGMRLTGQLTRVYTDTGPNIDVKKCTAVPPFRVPESPCAIPTICDYPEVRIVYTGNKYMYQYMSESAGRVVMTDSAAGIELDFARFKKVVGGGFSPRLNIDSYAMAFTHMIASRFVELGTSMRVVVKLKDGQVVAKRVNMAPYVKQFGSTLIKPAFSEYFIPPPHLLQQPAPDAVSYIASQEQINLGPMERLINEPALTLCYNYWWIRAMFGSEPPVPLEPNQTVENAVLVMAARLLGATTFIPET